MRIEVLGVEDVESWENAVFLRLRVNLRILGPLLNFVIHELVGHDLLSDLVIRCLMVTLNIFNELVYLTLGRVARIRVLQNLIVLNIYLIGQVFDGYVPLFRLGRVRLLFVGDNIGVRRLDMSRNLLEPDVFVCLIHIDQWRLLIRYIVVLELKLLIHLWRHIIHVSLLQLRHHPVLRRRVLVRNRIQILKLYVLHVSPRISDNLPRFRVLGDRVGEVDLLLVVYFGDFGTHVFFVGFQYLLALSFQLYIKGLLEATGEHAIVVAVGLQVLHEVLIFLRRVLFDILRFKKSCKFLRRGGVS